jgi:cytoskeletal protein RodZ
MSTTTGRRAGTRDEGVAPKRQSFALRKKGSVVEGGVAEETPSPGSRGIVLIGAEPRVDLLPPEVRASRKRDALARQLVAFLVIVIVVVIAGVAGATFFALQSQQALAAEQSKTQTLLAEQQHYSVVKDVQTQIGLTEAGQQIGASTEIDWNAFLNKVKATVPPNVTLTGVTLDSASPLATYQQSAVPLQAARVATVTLNVTSTSLPDLRLWLSALAKLPGVADTAPGEVTLAGTGEYNATATVHLNESAFDGRFNTQKGK